MAISTYTELQTAIGTSWLARTDLASRLPEFIALAEADIRRDLRKKVVINSAFSLSANPTTLPATNAELKSIRFNTSSLKHSLDGRSVAALSALRQTGTGQPTYYAVTNNQIMVDIDPDTAYTMEIVYYESLVALSGGAPTNSTLTESPDIYLYGSLLHSAPFLEHDERIGMWRAMYDTAVAKENEARERSELASAPMSIGLPVTFG